MMSRCLDSIEFHWHLDVERTCSHNGHNMKLNSSQKCIHFSIASVPIFNQFVKLNLGIEIENEQRITQRNVAP